MRDAAETEKFNRASAFKEPFGVVIPLRSLTVTPMTFRGQKTRFNQWADTPKAAFQPAVPSCPGQCHSPSVWRMQRRQPALGLVAMTRAAQEGFSSSLGPWTSRYKDSSVLLTVFAQPDRTLPWNDL